jgi:NADPH2:quinone reductase
LLKRRRKHIKALVIERNGEPSVVIHRRDLPEPTPGPGEVRVRMLLAAVIPMTG